VAAVDRDVGSLPVASLEERDVSCCRVSELCLDLIDLYLH